MSDDGQLVVRRCVFEGNRSATSGGGLSCSGVLDTSLVVEDCRFEGNESERGGGGLSFAGASLQLRRTDFIANTVTRGNGGSGGGGASLGNGDITVEHCRFIDNQAHFTHAGGVSSSGNSAAQRLRMSDTLFSGNQVLDGFRGGAWYVDAFVRPAELLRCHFEDNLAGEGGALYVNGTQCGGAEFSLSGSTFVGNATHAGGAGGALYLGNSCGRVDNCTFAGNTAGVGGAVAMIGEALQVRPAFFNCAFSGNQAGTGGALSMRGNLVPTLLNASIVGNSADVSGGGVHAGLWNGVPTPPQPRLVNSILWGNADAGGSGEAAQITVAAGIPQVNSCIVQGYTGSLPGVASLGADPLLADADGADDQLGTLDDDLTLLAGSPAIDSGNNTPVDLKSDVGDLDCDGDVDEPSPLDLAGVLRKADDPLVPDTGGGVAPVVDRGAFERGAWRRIEASLSGVTGEPCLVGAGNLVSGGATDVTLTNAAADETSGLFIGLGRIDFPLFYGGTLVPSPDVLLLIPTDGSGAWSLGGAFPVGVPSGFSFYLQAWVQDVAAPFGLSATDALQATTP